MNALELLELKTGTLIKGIDNSKQSRSILSLDGWNNSHSGSYMIRWIPDKEIQEIGFDLLDHNLPFEQKTFYLTPFKTVKNGITYLESRKDIYYEHNQLQIGKPIGMFLGESVFCSVGNAVNFVVLLKVLDVQKIGWIVLGCPNALSEKEDFDVY